MARAYAPIVHILALTAFLGWLWVSGGDVRLAVNVAAAVLIITCPCALALAVPAVVTAASGRLFRKGLLIKDGTALERLAEVDCVVFDKTGTLTLGAPEPVRLEGHAPADLALAAALSAGSAHPLSRALAAALAARGVAPAPVGSLRETPGHGVEAQWQGRRVRLGRADWAGAAEAVAGDEAGLSATWLGIAPAPGAAPEPARAFCFADSLRPGAAEAVAGLKAAGCRVMLLSGDAEAPVAALAGRLGLADWRAGVLPADKAAVIADSGGGRAPRADGRRRAERYRRPGRGACLDRAGIGARCGAGGRRYRASGAGSGADHRCADHRRSGPSADPARISRCRWATTWSRCRWH